MFWIIIIFDSYGFQLLWAYDSQFIVAIWSILSDLGQLHFFFNLSTYQMYNFNFKILWLVTWNMLNISVTITVSTYYKNYFVYWKNQIMYNELWSHQSTNSIQQIKFKIMFHSEPCIIYHTNRYLISFIFHCD